MVSYCEGKYEPKQNDFDFDSTRKILMKEKDKMVVKRRFERINDMITCKLYINYENNPENKEISIYGFKHIKTDKIDKYFLIGCESDRLNESNKLLNFWSNKILNEGIRKGKFEITGWSFMTLVKRSNFFKIQGICL